MKLNSYKLPAILLVLLLFCGGSPLLAQDGSSLPSREDADNKKKVQFNGLGRTILNNTAIGGPLLDSDSTTARSLTDGEFLLDVAINAQPNENSEVQGILRLRNEFGGFFGAGVTVEVRELWARGLIANTVRYRVGDFDHVMTPYTMFLTDEEGMVNEPEVFRPQKEVIEYEQFYTDNNSRRLQGAKVDFGLAFPKVLREMDANAFIARIRPTDFFTTPSRFIGGGQLDFTSRRLQDSVGMYADFGLNLSNVWDDLQSGNATTGIRNQVVSADFTLHLFENERFAVQVLGELGRSNLELADGEEKTFEEDDTFLEVGAALDLKKNKLRVSAAFLDVGPDFYSIAAQSKRVAFDRNKTFFNRIGNDRQFRMPTLFDLGRDRALYSYQFSQDLMAYDPRYANVMPYGKATANRRGVQIGAVYGDDDSPFNAELGLALLEEIRGQGTFELKNFVQVRLAADVHLDRMLDWEKTTMLTLGFQQEQTSRGGGEFEEVELTSNLIEVGLEAELFPRFDLLLGAKMLSAEGRDYVPTIEAFSEVEDFPAPFVADDIETLLGAGIRYRFQERIYLTVQYQQFDIERALNPTPDYDLRQVFAQYVMEF